MAELSRRKVLLSGGALGALGALGMASPAQARAAVDWTWAPSGSVAGTGAGADPRWVWDEEADPLVASLLDRGAVPEVNRLLWDWNRNDQPLPAGLPGGPADFMEKARQLPAWADRGQARTRRRVQQVPRAVPQPAQRRGRRHAQHRHPEGGPRGLLLQGRRGHGGPRRQDEHPRVRRRRPQRVPARRQLRRQRREDPAGARGGAAPAAAVAALGPATIPISQEDMLVTWHTLPTFAMRKMRRVGGADQPAADTEAYLHVWQVTAHLLGHPGRVHPRHLGRRQRPVGPGPAAEHGADPRGRRADRHPARPARRADQPRQHQPAAGQRARPVPGRRPGGRLGRHPARAGVGRR